MFYSIVPDPTGAVSCAHSAADIGQSVPATFLHELQHLIYFSQHVIVSGTGEGSSWMDEGLSIVAEELGSLYYEQKCPPPACRTSPAQSFPDSAQGFVSGFLYDSYQYANLPDTSSVTLHDDSEDGFSWRGAGRDRVPAGIEGAVGGVQVAGGSVDVRARRAQFAPKQ